MMNAKRKQQITESTSTTRKDRWQTRAGAVAAQSATKSWPAHNRETMTKSDVDALVALAQTEKNNAEEMRKELDANRERMDNAIFVARNNVKSAKEALQKVESEKATAARSLQRAESAATRAAKKANDAQDAHWVLTSDEDGEGDADGEGGEGGEDRV